MKRKAYSLHGTVRRATTSRVASKSAFSRGRGRAARAARGDFDKSLKRSISKNREALIALAKW